MGQLGELTSRVVGQQQRNWRLLLSHLLYSLGSALQPTNILTYVVFYNFWASPLHQHLVKYFTEYFSPRAGQSRALSLFFPLRRTMGRMIVLCHGVFVFIADIELRNSGVIPLHEAPWTGCLGV